MTIAALRMYLRKPLVKPSPRTKFSALWFHSTLAPPTTSSRCVALRKGSTVAKDSSTYLLAVVWSVCPTPFALAAYVRSTSGEFHSVSSRLSTSKPARPVRVNASFARKVASMLPSPRSVWSVFELMVASATGLE